MLCSGFSLFTFHKLSFFTESQKHIARGRRLWQVSGQVLLFPLLTTFNPLTSKLSPFSAIQDCRIPQFDDHHHRRHNLCALNRISLVSDPPNGPTGRKWLLWSGSLGSLLFSHTTCPLCIYLCIYFVFLFVSTLYLSLNLCCTLEWWIKNIETLQSWPFSAPLSPHIEGRKLTRLSKI